MARLKSQGLDALANDLKQLGKDITEVEEEMLDAGAQEIVAAWKEGITSAGHVDTGEMRDSVKATKKRKQKAREIYPQGKDSKGVRNAEKAFVNHYGKGSKPGDRFVDKIEDAAEPKAAARMQSILNAHLRKKGLM